MNTVSLVGIDLGKHCFHLHAQDASGKQVLRKQFTRSQMLMLLGNFSGGVVLRGHADPAGPGFGDS